MITQRIRNGISTLTTAERKIADFILANPDAVTQMKIKDLASVCNTSPAAVIRFCRSHNLDGFSDLKVQLARELGTQKTLTPLPALSFKDSTETVFKKVFQTGINTLENTMNMLDFSKIERIVQKMATAESILFLGVGTSSVIATDAQYRFSQLGLRASVCTDILFMNVNAGHLHSGDLAVGISHSGRTKATVDAMRRAKQAGAHTVAITSFSNSILYRECDDAIAVYSDEENYPVEAVSARVAHICLIDALMMKLAMMNYNSFEENLIIRNKILNDIRY